MAQFTKRAIMQAFMTLLEQKPLDKITVKDIIEECGVNRGTFYYYYQDIVALIDDIFLAETQRVLDENKSYDSWQDGFAEVVSFAKEHKKVIYHAYNSVSREKLESYLYRISDHLMMDFINHKAQGLDVSEEDKQFLGRFYKCALVGVMLEWIGRGMTDDAQKYIDKASTMLEGNIRQALERVSRK